MARLPRRPRRSCTAETPEQWPAGRRPGKRFCAPRGWCAPRSLLSMPRIQFSCWRRAAGGIASAGPRIPAAAALQLRHPMSAELETVERCRHRVLTCRETLETPQNPVLACLEAATHITGRCHPLHRPFQAGSRLSTNARAPSRASLLSNIFMNAGHDRERSAA